MSQLKRQDKTPGKKKKTGFRIMIVKMIQDLRKTMKIYQRPTRTKQQMNRDE